eukprot:4659086-Pleurochrysis_carterae.AAC.2
MHGRVRTQTAGAATGRASMQVTRARAVRVNVHAAGARTARGGERTAVVGGRARTLRAHALCAYTRAMWAHA